MPVLNLKQMKLNEPTRDFDESVDANVNIPAENDQGQFGAFKFFSGIRSFFKGISALGTLATTSRIPVTDANGNVSYTTPQKIKETLSLATTGDLDNKVTCKSFNSPVGAIQYVTVHCNESFGGILLSFSYAAQYLFDILNGAVNLSGTDYGLSGYAISEDKLTIYLKVTAYRKFSIINLSGNSDITISDASLTPPAGITFSTNIIKYTKTKTVEVTATVDANGSINLPVRLPNKIVSVYGSNKIYVPFVYIDYWVCYCMNVGGTKVASGTELTLTVTYNEG